MAHSTKILIVGAGPFGLSLAAFCKDAGMDFRIVGRPMSFWKEHMPEGMLLRSDCEWHLDHANEHTMQVYLESIGKNEADVLPLSLQFYLDYTEWFQQQKGIIVEEAYVTNLNCLEKEDGKFRAELDNGNSVIAENVVLALGFEYFKHIPEELSAIIPGHLISHTCDHVEFSDLAGKKCLIVGGRQSAFEWAALLRENEVARIDMVYRHETPAFVDADWSWAPPLIESSVQSPGYYQRLPAQEKEEIFQRFWGEGRLKLEPWLWPRIDHPNVRLWPKSFISECREETDGSLEITLNTGQQLHTNHIICATGYKVDINKIPLLRNGNILNQIKSSDNAPDLDPHFQSSIPGLYLTSMPATKDFGLFFAFTVSAVGAAKILGNHLKHKLLN